MLLIQSSERVVRMLQPNRTTNFKVTACALFHAFFDTSSMAFSVYI